VRIPPIKSIIAFEAVGRTRSITRAADELRISASAISHQIANLEALIGRPLFVREGRGLVLTPAGEQYFGEISQLLVQLGRATDHASGAAAPEIIRIHASPSFGLLWLLPRIRALQAEHAGFKIRLACSYEPVSFSGGAYDVDVRHGRGVWPGVEVRTIGGETLTPLASREFIAAHGLREPADLLRVPLIFSENPLVQWPQWFSSVGVSQRDLGYELSFDRSYMALEAARLGLGVCLESTLLAADYVASGQLEPIFDERHASPVGAHHVVYPSVGAERVAPVVNWILDAARGAAPITAARDQAA
jgi:DNA-binding transcriptional LysR family regulator